MLLYGVDNVSKLQTIKDVIGIQSAKNAVSVQAKIKTSNLVNYGVEATNSLQSVKDTKKETFQTKYGVSHQL
jgi:hypothetical protein